MMLHGCTQEIEVFAEGTAMSQAAEEHGCLVLYPEQPASANRQRCWNWFRPGNQIRGGGEPAELVALIESVALSYAVDRAQVFVAGLSAGACMAATLGIVYPDVFAAVGVCAGLPYGAARTAIGAMAAMQSGMPVARPRAADIAAQAAARGLPRLAAFHGLDDTVVAPTQSDYLVRQWAEIHRIPTPQVGAALSTGLAAEVRQIRPPVGHPYQEETYRNQRGEALIRRYLVQGMGHSWPGGAAADSYMDPAGPPASRLMLDFFLGEGR
jgi:poly(hydroxyalkanoate) depolymerase family esterase